MIDCKRHLFVSDYRDQCPDCCIAELEAEVARERERTYTMIQECNATQAELERLVEQLAEERAKNERLQAAIRRCDPLCPAWAALEGEQGE